MKNYVTMLLSLAVAPVFSQNYKAAMSEAANLMQNKEYCEAFDIFKNNLNRKTPAGSYDYYNGAVAAVKCSDTEKGLMWLDNAAKLGLGAKEGELEHLEKEEAFSKLHGTDEWKKIMKTAQLKRSEKQAHDVRRMTEWNKTITENSIAPGFKGQVPAGFALYYSESEGVKVPYLVYVPSDYRNGSSVKAIVYLHGGVVNAEEFQYLQPETATEPIFKYAERNGLIVIYPFGKKDFGWVNQPAAFENILDITKQVEKRYSIKEVYLGGMSNGGSAAFWFASQKRTPYKGFFAVSANPELATGPVAFNNINKPFYSLNAEDDEAFAYANVHNIYDAQKNKNWHFESVPQGGHGFIYGQNGEKLLADLLNKLIK